MKFVLRKTRNVPTYKRISGIVEIVNDYDAFVTSIFGVIHNKSSLIPGVRGCLEKLAENGKTILLLSNAPKRASTIIQQLSEIGIPPSLYQHIITAGEEAFTHLSQRSDPWHATLGKYCYYLGSTDDDDLIEDLEVYPVSDISRADFILAVGFDVWHKDIDYYDKILKDAVSLRLPMVCANPDKFIMEEGKKLLRAGFLAQRYQDYGGQVRFHGKPYKAFYDQVQNRLKRFDKNRILAIGDGLETDILGATMAGLKTAYVTSGLHGNKFSLEYKKVLTKEDLKEIFSEFKLEPNYILSSLKW